MYLARLLAGTDIPIHLHDGDIIEAKNLKRQYFNKDDVGAHKSDALSKHLKNMVLDCPPLALHDKYITDVDHFLFDISLAGGTPIIISAVDNIATRRLINKSLLSLDDYIAIDSGNNHLGGQVVVTSKSLVTYKQPFTDDVLLDLPNMLDIYQELQYIDDKNPGLDQSCDAVVESEPQAMMANVRNADVIANITHALIEGRALEGNVYESDLKSFETRVKLVTA